MRLTKLFCAMFVALSLQPVAFAQTAQQQYIDSAHGQFNNADSATAGYVPGVDQAPKTFIGGQEGSTSQAANQIYESQFVNNCPEGTTGINEYQRKTYVRQDGSIFADAWTLKTNNCKPNKDPAIADLYNNQTNIYNQLNEIKTTINNGAKGNMSPVFSITQGAYMGTTAGGSVRGMCISTKGFEGWPNLVVKDIVWDTLAMGQSSGIGMIGPWPNWPGTQTRAYQYVGPICPPGMGFTTIGESGPEGPSGE